MSFSDSETSLSDLERNMVPLLVEYTSILNNFAELFQTDDRSNGTWRSLWICLTYRKTSTISRTSVGNKIVDHSDVVGASPVGAAPTTPSFSTQHLASMDWAETTARGYKKHLFWDLVRLILEVLR